MGVYEMKFKIKLAGLVFQISSVYDYVYTMCSGYFAPHDAADVIINITEKEIIDEKEEMQILYGQQHPYSPDYLEMLAVYRRIATECLAYDTFLTHGAALSIRGGSYLITAKSGTGKTTVARILSKYCPDAFVINGDKPLISIEKDCAFAWGTPWSGKEHQNVNCREKLHAICLLERGDNTHFEEITFSEALPSLLNQVYKPNRASDIKKTFNLLGQLAAKVKFYRFCLQFLDDVHDIDEQTVCKQFITHVVEEK